MHGWTQAQLASMLGISRVSISQWESSNELVNTIPTAQNISKISELSDFPVEWIISDQSDLELPDGVKAKGMKVIDTAVFVDKKYSPIAGRIADAVEEISRYSKDGQGDEFLLSLWQMVSAHRRLYKKTESIDNNIEN